MKTAELTGVALDWAVSLIEFPEPDYDDNDRFIYVRGDNEFHFTPSSDWSQGGPIIEREHIGWADFGKFFKAGDYKGPTPLIAAMRCYVASKLGDIVEVPHKLTGAN